MRRRGHREVMTSGLNEPTKIRKRGCSSSPSSSSRIYNYRFSKRAILVGKNRAGVGRSRSSTPVPTWRTTGAIETPKYSQSGRSAQPVSARRLAATLWEMNEMPSPKMSESDLEVRKRQQRKSGSRKGEKLMQSGWGLHSSSGSGYLPPHLSDPPHSPTVSQKMPTSSRRRQSISQKLMSADRNIDSVSNASFMETESRSRHQISTESAVGGKNRLKEASSALTTSKELLKIINRLWAQADQPSSSMSLISALHSELERARLQVNQLIQEQRSEKNDIGYLIKCFAEEKASWKNQEHLAVEAAVGPLARELDAERKLRRRLESLNAKLGQELAEIKSSFIKAVKELESEKRAREIAEQVYDELARNIDQDRAGVDKPKRDCVGVHQQVEEERELLELADKLHEERAQMKVSEAKHQFEEKSSAVSKLRKQLEAFLGTKRDKVDEVVEDGGDSKEEDSADSDLHSIELELNNNNSNEKGHCKWAYTSAVEHKSRRTPPASNDTRARNSISGKVSRGSTSLQRSASDGVEWSAQGAGNQHMINEGIHEVDNEVSKSSYLDEMQRFKTSKGFKNQLLSSSRLGIENHNLSKKKEHSYPPRDLSHEKSKSRTAEGSRGSKW
ncbi:paramyosin-like [Salvia divinorum]|uniref:Paramyosin-like n=1 Tax=Salvia divinorum TaxID=28513 RepID=A0ABD1GYM8_SALDI